MLNYYLIIDLIKLEFHNYRVFVSSTCFSSLSVPTPGVLPILPTTHNNPHVYPIPSTTTDNNPHVYPSSALKVLKLMPSIY